MYGASQQEDKSFVMQKEYLESQFWGQHNYPTPCQTQHFKNLDGKNLQP